MNSIKELIDHGAYSVDAKAVADAIIRRMVFAQTAGHSATAGPASGSQTRSE